MYYSCPSTGSHTGVSAALTLYIQLNEPKYHAMPLRSVEGAKHGEAAHRQILWMIAQDVPNNPRLLAGTPMALDQQRMRFLQMHDQKTAGPCRYALASLCYA